MGFKKPYHHFHWLVYLELLLGYIINFFLIHMLLNQSFHYNVLILVVSCCFHFYLLTHYKDIFIRLLLSYKRLWVNYFSSWALDLSAPIKHSTQLYKQYKQLWSNWINDYQHSVFAPRSEVKVTSRVAHLEHPMFHSVTLISLQEV